jgi:hypothetical protein
MVGSYQTKTEGCCEALITYQTSLCCESQGYILKRITNLAIIMNDLCQNSELSIERTSCEENVELCGLSDSLAPAVCPSLLIIAEKLHYSYEQTVNSGHIRGEDW